AAAEPEVSIPDNKTARLCCIMGRCKRLNHEPPDRKMLVKTAHVAGHRFIGSAPVGQEIAKRPSRRVHRYTETTGEHVEPSDMIAVFMGDEDRFDPAGVQPRTLHAKEGLFCAQPCINEN